MNSIPTGLLRVLKLFVAPWPFCVALNPSVHWQVHFYIAPLRIFWIEVLSRSLFYFSQPALLLFMIVLVNLLILHTYIYIYIYIHFLDGLKKFQCKFRSEKLEFKTLNANHQLYNIFEPVQLVWLKVAVSGTSNLYANHFQLGQVLKTRIFLCPSIFLSYFSISVFSHSRNSTSKIRLEFCHCAIWCLCWLDQLEFQILLVDHLGFIQMQ